MYKPAGLTITTWENAVLTFPEANFLSSWAYGESQKASGCTVLRELLEADGKFIVVQAIVRDARRGRYLEIGAGPLLDWQNQAASNALLAVLKRMATENKCVFVRLRPQLLSTQLNVGLFKQLGFKPAPMHLFAEHTSIIDLSSRPDDLLLAMRKKTRYQVRSADKLGITVSVDNSNRSVNEFYDLLHSTASRQGFVLGSRDQLTLEISTLIGAGYGQVYSSYLDDQLLAMAFIVSYATEADYLYGASTVIGRNHPGAYAVQWRAIQDAVAAGLKTYNLWGTAPEDQPKHRYSNVTTFKRGFGGQSVSYLPAHDMVYNKLAYAKNWLIESARKKKRGL